MIGGCAVFGVMIDSMFQGKWVVRKSPSPGIPDNQSIFRKGAKEKKEQEAEHSVLRLQRVRQNSKEHYIRLTVVSNRV